MWKPWEPTKSDCNDEVLVASLKFELNTECYQIDCPDSDKWSFFKINNKGDDFVEVNFYKRVFNEAKYEAEKAKYERDIVEYNKWVANEIETKERRIRFLKTELDRLSKRE